MTNGRYEGLLDREIPALEALLAEEFLIVDVASGPVHPRAAFLAAISARMGSFQEIETSRRSVPILGGSRP